jgi:hypothetical protein
MRHFLIVATSILLDHTVDVGPLEQNVFEVHFVDSFVQECAKEKPLHHSLHRPGSGES